MLFYHYTDENRRASASNEHHVQLFVAQNSELCYNVAINDPQAGRGQSIELSLRHCSPPHPSRDAINGDIRPCRMGMVVVRGDNTRAEEGLYGKTPREYPAWHRRA